MPIKREVIIGNCRLLQGDCMQIMPLLPPVETLISDPPYGMRFVSNHRKNKYNPIVNDENADLLRFACSIDVLYSKYIFCRWDNLFEVPKPKSCITWVKNNWSMGDLKHEHARQTEIVLFYAGKGHIFPSGRPTDVIKCARTGNKNHPTEKPVPLMMEFIKWSIGAVTDCFMGSGTTGVAAVKMGRPFIGIEQDSQYFDIAVKRITEVYEQSLIYF